MAYVPKNKRKDSVSENVSRDAKLKDIFADLDKLNEDASLLSDSSLSLVDEWIDTGSLALNAIFSGSLYKGIPRGRVTGFIGNPATGKTLIVNKIAANAQKMGYFVCIWDSESAVDSSSAQAAGLDPTRVKYYPVQTVEDCRNQIVKFLRGVSAVNDPDLKVICIIDSLGNLSTKKEQEDIDKDNNAVDMGSRAKALGSLMRTLTYPAAKARVPVLYTNHIYDNPGEMHPTMVKTQSGGKKATYIGSIIAQLAARNEKIDNNEEEAKSGLAHGVSGITLTALTTKNRFVPPYLKAELYLNFRSGLAKYAGLKEMVVQMGIVQLEGKTYTMNGEKIGYAKNWENDPVFWEKALPLLEAGLQKELRYNQMDEIPGELDPAEVDPDSEAETT